MADNNYIEAFIHWLIKKTVYPFYRIIYFYKKNCWRISIHQADKLGYNQISNTTEENRYPEIFDYVKKMLSDKNEICILSFGCSYGWECKSLRNYFPNAFIIGYDIFKENIDIAAKKNDDCNIKFTSEWENVKKEKYFDIVFAMSVLCRTPHTINKKNISKIYSFERFEKQITELDSIIRKDGLLVLYNTNFLFTDTIVSEKYEPLSIPNFYDSGRIPKFDKNNKLLENQEYQYSIFRKTRNDATDN